MRDTSAFTQKRLGQTMTSGHYGRWTVILGALLVQVILGTVYGFSVFVRPLELEFGWTRAVTQWAFSTALVTFAVTMIPAGHLQDRFGPRVIASVAGALARALLFTRRTGRRAGAPLGVFFDLRHNWRGGHRFRLCLPHRRRHEVVP